MEAFLGLLFFIILLGSIVTSFVAIFQIATNDFKESKGLWILLSMVAIIGPVLYLLKGRKLIVKKDYNQHVNEDGSSSIKQYYLQLFSELDIKVKALLGVSIGLIGIGYLVRIIGLYFFWESKPIGFFILLISLAIFLRKDIVKRKSLKLKNIISQIGFWLAILISFGKVFILLVLLNSDAYTGAKMYLETNDDLISKVGKVTGHTILPSGSIQLTTDSRGAYGAAVINLIIKGENKFIEQTIYVNKTPDKDWSVVMVE